MRPKIFTLNQALAAELIEVVARADATGTFLIRFGTIPTIIKIQLIRYDDGRFVTAQDHAKQPAFQILMPMNFFWWFVPNESW